MLPTCPLLLQYEKPTAQKQKREAHAPRWSNTVSRVLPWPTRLAVGLGHMEGVLRYQSRFAPCPKLWDARFPRATAFVKRLACRQLRRNQIINHPILRENL